LEHPTILTFKFGLKCKTFVADTTSDDRFCEEHT